MPLEQADGHEATPRQTEASRLSNVGEAQLRALFDVMPQLGWTAQPDGFIDFYNRGWYAYTGTNFEAMKGWGWKSVHHPEMLQPVTERWLESLRTGAHFEMEFPLRRHDGSFRWFLTRVQPMRAEDGSILRWVGINTDIHERREAGAQSGENYRLLVESIQDYAILTVDPAGRVLTWNRGAESIKGYSADEVVGQHLSRFYLPEDIAAGKPTLQLETAARDGRCVDEGWRLRKDGSRLWASDIINALRAHDGSLRGFVKATHDETVRKLAVDATEERRRVEEERVALFELSTDLIGIAGIDGHFKRLNPSWTKTLGWSNEELTSKPWLSFVHPEDFSGTVAAGASLAKGHTVSSFQNRYRCKSGEYAWLDWRCVPSLDHALFYAIARDVTEERRARAEQENTQQKLIVADRMISVGTLAAGVAHEINNPLAYVMANLNVAIEEVHALSGGSPSGRIKELEEMVGDALEGATRVAKIVRSLKTFSRSDHEQRAVVDIHPTLELAINMAFNEIRHRARLVKDFGVTPLIEADEARLGQVFINLLVNAAQAIPEGNAQGNEVRITTSTDPTGNLVVEVRDTGPGIPLEIRGRLYQPFFTTKPVGVGTGLGLSVCHNIVTSMGGDLSVLSELGKGATFRVVLPPSTPQKLPVAAPALQP